MHTIYDSYGHEGYQILSLTLMSLFPDRSFDLAPFKPLVWSDLIHKVLLPEAVVQLIGDDLPNLDRAGAINTMKLSAHFGNVLHYNEDSPTVRDITKKLAAVNSRINTLYDEYEMSQSSLNFNQWVQERQKQLDVDLVIKQEETDMGSSADKSVELEIIDLTLDE